MRSDLRYVEVQGERVPSLGFGTWQLHGDECASAVADALRIGYRLVDTAQQYGNEAAVGAGIRASGVDRDEVWVATKVWWENLSYEECLESAEASLARLGLVRIDLLLIHWPNEALSMDEPLSAMKKLRDAGTIRHIGVSNFPPSLLQKALDRARLLTNQVEYHPFLAQDRLLEMAEENDLMLTAYSPLAQARVLADSTLQEIGRAHGKTPVQVALRWLLQQPRVAAIPKASSAEHRRENLKVFDFELSRHEMERISGLDRGVRLVDPEFAPEWESSH